MANMQVHVSDGILQGKQTTTSAGGSYFSFQGIRYAKAPLGDLRFREPQLPEPWEGVRDATKEGGDCAQCDMLIQKKEYLGVEDCLFLNVYSPSLLKPADKGPGKLPVMVWFHGGGFISGSGSTAIYGPEFFMEKDVVVVTINYRLGVLGFLNLNTPEVPGNAGLKDQIMALRWIRDNIKNFNGDSNNVTVFGESAGAASVQYLMVSPMARGLFHKGIAQSGSCLTQWAYASTKFDDITKASMLTETIGNKATEAAEILKVLQAVPVEDLVRAVTATAKFEEMKKDCMFPFAPVVEKIHPNQEAFLTESAEDLWNAGKIAKIPLITGFTNQEGIIWSLGYLSDPDYFENYNNNFQLFVPIDLNFPINSTQSVEISNKIREFYFQKRPLSKDSIHDYFDMMTDLAYLRKMMVTVRGFVNSSPAIYVYRMSYDGDLNLLKKLCDIDYEGACHGDDLGYMFKPSIISLTTPENSPESIIRHRFVQMWTNFAKFGNPTPETTELLPVKWEPITKSDIKFLDIDAGMQMEISPESTRVQFWDEIQRDYRKS